MGPKPRAAIWVSAIGIAVFQVVGSFGAAANQPTRRGVDAFALVLVLLGPAALAVRDRFPSVAVGAAVVAADVYVGVGYPYGPIFLSVVVALFAGVAAGRRRETWLLAGVGFVGFIAASAVDPRASEGVGAVHLALVAGWLVVVLAISEVVRVRRDRAAEAERARREERQRRIGDQRLRLAQDLHDVLAHNISLINVQASVALHLLDEQPDEARPALTTIKEASRDALHELRTALDLLRRGDDAPLAPAPGLADLPALVDGVRAGGLDVRFTPPTVSEGTIPAAVELVAYRIVQEALTNATRHARARVVTVGLGYSQGDALTVEVTDDGIGGRDDAAPGLDDAVAGNGIAGMRERAAAVGGTVEAGPRRGGGFEVIARLPVDPR
ncbi:MAG TPA: sensor histidine kinase [Acidimicrobiales bacterium]|nr:sensor histidine kinase [Acidimicrobiales bacterium]